MKKVELLAVVLAMTFGFTPFLAHARQCELPHEQIQQRCGGESPNTFDAESKLSDDAVSGIDKTKKSAQQLLKEYREKAQAYGAIVKKANDDYRDYLAQKAQARDNTREALAVQTH